MNLKKILFLSVFMTVFSSGFAQVNWNAKVGLNYSNIIAKDSEGNKANTSAVPGLYLGLGVGIPLSELFSIQPTLAYVQRGFTESGQSKVGWGKDFEAKTSYIELPVDFQYSPKIGPGNLLVAIGPYLGYGTGGKWKTEGPVTVGDIMFDGKGDIAFQNDGLMGGKGTNSHTFAKPWDYGVHFRLGYALFGQYTVSLDIQQGIADLEPRLGEYKPKSTLRNKSIGMTLSYDFN